MVWNQSASFLFSAPSLIVKTKVVKEKGGNRNEYM